jgi:hypothetical protein
MFALLIRFLFMASIAAAGAWGGAKLQHAVDDHQVGVCAGGIRQGNLAKACPSAIADAFATLAAPIAQKEIEYRDKTIPLIVDNGTAARAEADQLRSDLATLQAQDKTHACASTPAFVELRRQLCREAGGKAGPDCAANAPAS